MGDLVVTSVGSGVYVRPTSRRLGRQVSLEDLDDPQICANLDLLRAEEVGGAGVCDSTSMELAAAVVSASNGRAVVEGEPVDVVVVCTDTLEGLDPTGWITRYQELSGTELTTTLMVSGHACANAVVGLEVCRSLVASGTAGAVQLLTADRIYGRSRFTPASNSVYSDGAAACLVSTDPARALELLRSGMQAQALVAENTVGMAAARSTLLSMASAVSRARDQSGSDEVRHVLGLNLGKTARDLLAMAASVPPASVRPGSSDSLGHCFAADVLLALEELLAGGSCRTGDNVLMLASGRHVLSALSLVAG